MATEAGPVPPGLDVQEQIDSLSATVDTLLEQRGQLQNVIEANKLEQQQYQEHIDCLRSAVDTLTEQNNDMHEAIGITKLEVGQFRKHKNQPDKNKEVSKDFVSKVSMETRGNNNDLKRRRQTNCFPRHR